MKIPRFAFISMVLLIVGLSSGLVVVRARSNAASVQQSPVVTTLTLPHSGSHWQCALFANAYPDSDSCASILSTGDGGQLEASMRLLAKDADGVTLGIRTRFVPALTPSGTMLSTADLQKVPLEKYRLHLGGKVNVQIEGLGTAELTSEPLDTAHFFPAPPARIFLPQTLDPHPDQLRIISPLLLKGREVVFDMEGASASGAQKNGAVVMYVPGLGRLIVAEESFTGAVKGDVNLSRINFEINGQHYRLLAGAPISRAKNVWVRLDPNFQPADSAAAITWSTPPRLLRQNQ